MKIIKPMPLGILTRAYRSDGREYLGIAIPTMATLGETPRLVGETELWDTVGDALSGYTLDAALPKAHAEFLVSAHAYGKYCNAPMRATSASASRASTSSCGSQATATGPAALAGLATRPRPRTVRVPADRLAARLRRRRLRGQSARTGISASARRAAATARISYMRQI